MDQASFDFTLEPSPMHSDRNLPATVPNTPPLTPEPNSTPAPVPLPRSKKALTAQPPRTLADVVVAIDTWSDLPKGSRDVFKSHIRTCGLVIATAQARDTGQLRKLSRKEVQLAQMPFDVDWINQWLHRHPWRVIGLESYKSFRNSKSGLRHVARRLGVLYPMQASHISSDSSWRPFLDAAVTKYVRPGIARFVAWCEENRIEPPGVGAETFVTYEAFVHSRLIHKQPRRLITSIKNHWKKTAREIAGWPALDIPASNGPGTYTLPLTEYPESFQNDVASFGRRLDGTDVRGPFRRIAVRRPCRPATIKLRLQSIRMAAAALVASGQAIATFTSLADLVTPEAAEIILQFYWDRTLNTRSRRGELQPGEENQPFAGSSAQTDVIANTLLSIARHHVVVAPEALVQIKELAADVRREKQSGLTPKNRERLRQFDDPRTRLELLCLSEKLMGLATNADMQRGDAARMARQAVMIGLLCRIPLRAENLRNLRMGRNLKFGDGSADLANRLEFQASETKNRSDLEFSVGKSVANLLRIYITRFLPFFSEKSPDFQEHGWLFATGGGKPGPISESTLGKCVREPIAEHVGADANPHLFRSLMARIKLEHSPGALEDVRLLLGDKTMTVVLRHYAALEPVMASRRHDELIDREQARLSRLAPALSKRERLQ